MHLLQNVIWQSAITVILGWFVGRTWKITISDIPNHLSNDVIFIEYTLFTNVTAVHIIHTGARRVEDPHNKGYSTNRSRLTHNTKLILH
jgi:hypothetical protein